jgi:DNA polymerase III epsilon subunit-like protein
MLTRSLSRKRKLENTLELALEFNETNQYGFTLCNIETLKQEDKINRFIIKGCGQYHLIFDTETTGLFNEPHITQLSYVIWDNYANPPCIIEQIDHYCKLPPNVLIDEKAKEKTGITEEMCETLGLDVVFVLNEFLDICKKYNISWFVAHNIEFDKKIMETNLKRYHLPYNGIFIEQTDVNTYRKPKNTYCTKLTSQGKWPTLEKMYIKMFGESPPNGLHNSMIDVLVCLRCYVKRRFQIDIPTNVLNDYILN